MKIQFVKEEQSDIADSWLPTQQVTRTICECDDMQGCLLTKDSGHYSTLGLMVQQAGEASKGGPLPQGTFNIGDANISKFVTSNTAPISCW